MTTIDDLFQEEPEARIELFRTRLTPIGVTVQTVAFAAALAGLFWGLAKSVDYSVPYPLLFLSYLALLLGVRLVVALRAPAGPTMSSLALDLPEEVVADQSFVEARHWIDRLDWMRGDLDQFRWTVLPAIKALADERLRLRHGITRFSHPERAAHLLGPNLTAFLDARQLRQVPTPVEMSELVKELEAL
ncbi:MAG: hypothetical protein H0T78_02065 [Longispora sp.]|nr:hypothetical protein [Longispora sp. (in: high G+C Gram-positive bacteria)]